jgi:hypothetical protein
VRVGLQVGKELHDVLSAHAPSAALAWLEQGLGALSSEPAQAEQTESRVLALFAGAGRRFGRAERPWDAAAQEALRAVGYAASSAISLADAARARILSRACELLPPEAAPPLLTRVFETGDTQERTALLRALAVLPQPERFVALAIDACRSHVTAIFEAIACENAYPARVFPEPAFNQLVMKALFVEVPLERVVGWANRSNAELARMARDFEAERRAAGRRVPQDVGRILSTMENEP